MSYSSTLSRFMQTDPEQYIDGPNMYQMERSNPVNGLDPLGLALNLMGDKNDVAKIQEIIDRVKSELGKEVKKILDEIGSDSTVCSVKLVAESKAVTVGDYRLSTIDMGDLSKLPTGVGKGYMTQEVAVVHELVEQWEKQKYGRDIQSSHTEALRIESQVSSARRDPVDNRTTSRDGFTTVTWTFRKFIHLSDGKVRTEITNQIIKIKDGDLISVQTPTTQPTTQP